MCGQKTEKEATELAAIIKKQTFTLDMLRPFAGSIAPVYTGDTGNVFAMDLQEDGDPIVLSGTERVELIASSLMEDLRTPLKRAERENVVLLASGDPLYYGIGGTIARLAGSEHLRVIPCVTAFQKLFAALLFFPFPFISPKLLSYKVYNGAMSVCVNGVDNMCDGESQAGTEDAQKYSAVCFFL